MTSFRRWAFTLGVFLFLAASARAGEATENLWIDLYQGEPVEFKEMLDDLTAADVIYLGEFHTIERHHVLQERILSALSSETLPPAIGLEQIEAWRQPEVDRFNRGEIDFDQLALAIDWPKLWGNYKQYRPILEAARKQKSPIIALNAKAQTIRLVARGGGVEKMPADARKELPAEMQLNDPSYEKMLSLQLKVHGQAMPPEILRPMIEAQMARDEMMAQTIASYLESKEGKGRKMIVICGGGHVARGLGTPVRVKRRMPSVNDRIVLFSESGELKVSPAEQAMAANATITHEQLRGLNQPLADYLFVKPMADNAAAKGNPPIPIEVERAMLGEGHFKSQEAQRMKDAEKPIPSNP